MASSIRVGVDVDAKKAQEELEKVNAEIRRLEAEIDHAKGKRLPLTEQSAELAAQLDAAKAKLEALHDAGAGKDAIARQKENVAYLQSQYDAIENKIAAYDKQLVKAGGSLREQTARAGELTAEVSDLGTASARAGAFAAAAANRAGKSVDSLRKRLTKMAKRVLLFSFALSALRAMRDYIKDAVAVTPEASRAVAQLKGALLTLAQPLLGAVIPAFTALVNVLTRVVSLLANLTARAFGTTASASASAAEKLNDEKKALNGVGGAAKKASRNLAAFDEINQLSGSSTAETEPDFSTVSELAPKNLDILLGTIQAIGAALAAWKLGAELGLGLKQTLGLAVAIYSAIELVKDISDAWVNGIGWGGLVEVLLDVAGLAVGLGVAFGPVGAAIGLIVGGLAMLALGFRDADANGVNLKNTLMTIAGLLATGLGISILTGSFIPLLIAAILSILVAFANVYGHGQELIDGLKEMFRGFVDFFRGVFTGDVDLAVQGIRGIFDGLKEFLFGLLYGLRDAVNSLLDWLNDKAVGKLRVFNEVIRFIFNTAWDFIADTVGSIVETVKELFIGLIQFLTGVFSGDWDLAWKGIVNMAIALLNGLIGAFESVLGVVAKGINAIIEGINFVVVKAGAILGTGWTGISFRSQAPSFGRIPLLAQGAVIPPNREFLAVLGDQSSGNNIEAPEELLRQMASEAAGTNTALLQQIISLLQSGRVLMVDSDVLARLAYKGYNSKNGQYGDSLISVRGG